MVIVKFKAEARTLLMSGLETLQCNINGRTTNGYTKLTSFPG